MNDYLSGEVTIGEIDKIVFHFKSKKKCTVHISKESWRQEGTMIDPNIINVMIGEMHEQGYLDRLDQND